MTKLDLRASANCPPAQDYQREDYRGPRARFSPMALVDGILLYDLVEPSPVCAVVRIPSMRHSRASNAASVSGSSLIISVLYLKSLLPAMAGHAVIAV